MSRTVIEVPMKTNNVNGVLQIVGTKLESAGFSKKIVDGENIWAKGDGVLMKMQCVGVVFTGSSVLIQAWMKDAVTGESDLNGFVAIFPKMKLKKIINEIHMTIMSRNL